MQTPTRGTGVSSAGESRNISTDAPDPADKRVADAVKTRRLTLGMANYSELADKAGVSAKTVERVETAGRGNRMTYLKLEQALEWPVGHIAEIRRGTAPIAVTLSQMRAAAARAAPIELKPDPQALATWLWSVYEEEGPAAFSELRVAMAKRYDIATMTAVREQFEVLSARLHHQQRVR